MASNAQGSSARLAPTGASGTAGAFEHIGPVQGFGRSDGIEDRGIAPARTSWSKCATFVDGWAHPA